MNALKKVGEWVKRNNVFLGVFGGILGLWVLGGLFPTFGAILATVSWGFFMITPLLIVAMLAQWMHNVRKYLVSEKAQE